MEKKNFVLWFYGKAIVVMKIREDNKIIFKFCYSFSDLEAIGVTEEEMKNSIEEFIRDKDERTVLSEDIENYDIVNLDD